MADDKTAKKPRKRARVKTNTWTNDKDGRVRRTREGTAADKRYDQLSGWSKK